MNKKSYLFLFFAFLSLFLSRFNVKILVSWYLFQVVLILFFIFTLIKGKVKIDSFVRIPISLFLVFFIYASLSGLWAGDPLNVLKMIFGLFFCFLTLIMASALFSSRAHNELDEIFFSVGLFVCIVSIIFYVLGIAYYSKGIGSEGDVIWGVLIEKGTARLVGFQADPNFMAFVSLIFVYFFMSIKRRGSKLIALLFIMMIFLTLSRSGLLAFLVGCFFYIAFSKKRLFGFSIMAVLGSATIFYIVNADNLSRVVEARISGLESGAGRFEIWSNAFQIYSESPFFGIGLFQFKEVMSERFDIALYAHNTYLEVLVETGIFGFMLFLIFVFSISFQGLVLKEKNWVLATIISLLIFLLSLSAIASPVLYFSLIAVLLIGKASRAALPERFDI